MAFQAYHEGPRPGPSAAGQDTSTSERARPRHTSASPHALALALGHEDDSAERNADRIAELALSDDRSGRRSGVTDSAVHRPSAIAPPVVDAVVDSPGRPLDGSARAYFEPRFGIDLSTVRIHDDAAAAESARAVGAHAYTVADHIAFADGRYAPSTERGRQLIAHELAHVAQPGAQRASVVRRRAASGPEALPGYCPPRAVGELEASRRDWMDVREVASPAGAEDVLVANFAIEEAKVKGHPRDTALWRGLVAEMEAQPDERWEIVGFSDCSGDEAVNDKLRRQRAAAIDALLPPSLRARVTAVRAAPAGDYMTGNESPLMRSWNRSALIRHAGGFKRVALPAERIEARPTPKPSTTKPSQDIDMWPKWKDRSWLSDAWDDVMDAGKWALRHAKNYAVDAVSDAIDDAIDVGKWALRRAKDLYHAGKWTAKVLKGGFKAAWSTAEGLVSAIAHPIRTIEGVFDAITHPGRTAKAIASSMLVTIGRIGRGDPEAIGSALFVAATFIVPGAAEEELAEMKLLQESEVAGATELNAPRQIRLMHGTTREGQFSLGGLREGRIDVAFKSGAREDLGQGFYMTTDEETAFRYAYGRNIQRAPGERRIPHVLAYDVGVEELGTIVDIRPGGNFRVAWERFLDEPPSDVPALLRGTFGMETRRAYITGIGVEERGVIFEEFLRSVGMERADTIFAPLGDEVFTGITAGRETTQVCIRSQKVADRLNAIMRGVR